MIQQYRERADKPFQHIRLPRQQQKLKGPSIKQVDQTNDLHDLIQDSKDKKEKQKNDLYIEVKGHVEQKDRYHEIILNKIKRDSRNQIKVIDRDEYDKYANNILGTQDDLINSQNRKKLVCPSNKCTQYRPRTSVDAGLEMQKVQSKYRKQKGLDTIGKVFNLEEYVMKNFKQQYK